MNMNWLSTFFQLLKIIFQEHTIVSMPSKDNPNAPYQCSCGVDFPEADKLMEHIYQKKQLEE
jgi:hypothetical protein